MAPTLMTLGVALTALLGGAHTMAVDDGTRSLSCCGRATFDLNSDDANFHSTSRVNNQDTTMDLIGSSESSNNKDDGEETSKRAARCFLEETNQTSSTEPPNNKDDGKKKSKRAARSIKEVIEILQSNGDQREPIEYKDLVTDRTGGGNRMMASKRPTLKQQMNEEGDMLWNKDSFYSTKSPVPPEPLVGLSRLTESLDETLDQKPVDQKSLEIALKLKNCYKGKQKLDQTYYLM